MTVSTDIVLGIDIGTTSSKAVARSASRRGTPYVEQRTPWHSTGDGQTEIDPYRIVDVAVDLIGRAVVAAECEEFLTSVALPRLERLVDVAAERARPWTEV